MPNNFKETLQELIREVSNDPSLPSDQKVKFLGDLQKLATPLQSDRWIFRLVVAFLGLTVLLTVLGGFYLSIKTAATIPEGLIALGSAAVGALAEILKGYIILHLRRTLSIRCLKLLVFFTMQSPIM